MSKITEFKYIVSEFRDFEFPKIIHRDLNIPKYFPTTDFNPGSAVPPTATK